MGENIFERFNDMFDTNDLAKSVAEANSGNVEKKDVPFGDYEVRVTKLVLEECTFDGDYKGMPQLNIWFKIINNDEYSGQLLFCTKRLVSVKKPSATSFMIHKVNEFLESLESGVPVVFENFVQYKDLIDEIFNAIDGRAEYQLAYYENKGYKDYTITQRFKN
jgi:hypothetical protein